MEQEVKIFVTTQCVASYKDLAYAVKKKFAVSIKVLKKNSKLFTEILYSTACKYFNVVLVANVDCKNLKTKKKLSPTLWHWQVKDRKRYQHNKGTCRERNLSPQHRRTRNQKTKGGGGLDGKLRSQMPSAKDVVAQAQRFAASATYKFGQYAWILVIGRRVDLQRDFL